MSDSKDKPTPPAASHPESSTPRRDFLKQVASAAGVGSTAGRAAAPLAAAAAASAATAAAAQTAPSSAPKRAVEFPRRFEGAALRTIAFPLGGVGTGCVSLGGRGNLRDWEMFNRSDKGNNPLYGFSSIWAQAAGAEPVARVLEARLRPPYEGDKGLWITNAPGLPRLDKAVFTGKFPFAEVEFEDRALPLDVKLEAFSPFIPLDAEASGAPVAVLRYRLRNRGTKPVRVSISFNLENPVGVEGRTNTLRDEDPLSGVLMTNPFLDAKHPLKGSFAIAVLNGPDEITRLTGWRGGSRWRVAPLAFWDDFSEDGRLDPDQHTIPQPIASVCASDTIQPGQERAFTFLLAWHFPNRTPERCGWRSPQGEEKALIGNYYCTQFSDAWDAAWRTAERLDELEGGTRDFLDAMVNSSAPPAVLDAAMSNLSTLRTNTCFRTADGRFHAFEGCFDERGCCFGSCTHVWNYESALAFLFPEFSRSLREYQFGWIVDERGVMDFRYYLPYGKRRFGRSAADGQMGVLMKLYLDWKLSGDTAWLREHWPAAKRALEFSWIENGWDADRDGVMEGVQHNTYDIEFYGPNPLSGIWYLGALRACEQMARALGESEFAEECRRLFENGRKWIDANLFSGEFYIQKVQGRPASRIPAGTLIGMGAADSEHPDFQMGEGCLADQLLGQYFAHIAGLGDLIDSEHAAATLAAIYKYNFKPDLSEHESVQRVYALNDDAGLVICDYAGRPRPKIPFPYYAEIWTGIEYQVAAHMFYQGLYEEGLELVEAVRRRHDGERRNPWNEPECGHHYARALAAWSCVLAISGFDYSAPEEKLALRPRAKGETVRGFWSVPSGWGAYSLSGGGKEIAVEVKRGSLRLRRIELAGAGGAGDSVKAEIGGRSVAASLVDGVIRLERAAVVKPGAVLKIRLA